MPRHVPVPLGEGLGVQDSARRLAAMRLVLRELVHAGSGRLALEPRFEVKVALGGHLYDDARSVAKLDRRLGDLPAVAEQAPEGALATALDRLPREPWLAYEILKPAVLAAARDQLARLEPVADEPTLRVLVQLAHRQERHLAEMEVRPSGDVPPLETHPGPWRALPAGDAVGQPARDAFIRIAGAGERGDGALHDLIHAKLCAAELAARAAHEDPDAPCEFQLDMARLAADLVRHAAVCDRVAGGTWGTHPVQPGFAAATAPPALPAAPASVFEHMRAEEAAHARIRAKWGR